MRAPTVEPGSVLYRLGELTEVAYWAEKDGEEAIWVHDFSRRNLPTLAATSTGGLVVVGGGYRVTRRGIVG